MAIPTTPGGDISPIPQRRSAPPRRERAELPSIELPDSIPEPRVERQVPQQKPVSPQSSRPQRSMSSQEQKPVKKKTAPRVEKVTEVPVENELPEGWAIDKKTGKKYKVLPKTEYDADGMPMLQITDFDDSDLNSEAEKFLAHLRVPPDKAEQQRLRELRAEMQREANRKYAKAHKDENNDEDPNED